MRLFRIIEGLNKITSQVHGRKFHISEWLFYMTDSWPSRTGTSIRSLTHKRVYDVFNQRPIGPVDQRVRLPGKGNPLREKDIPTSTMRVMMTKTMTAVTVTVRPGLRIDPTGELRRSTGSDGVHTRHQLVRFTRDDDWRSSLSRTQGRTGPTKGPIQGTSACTK